MTLDVYRSALDWLGRGFHVLPIQPGTKKQVTGFGLHQRRITNMQQAAQWFKSSRLNLAVIAPADKFILDFDDWYLYLSWVRRVSDPIAQTYTEMTPRGGAHAFFSGQPGNLTLVPGVEIKRVVLVAPSVVGEGEYSVLHDGTMYGGPLDLSPLSKTPPSLAPASPRVHVAPGPGSKINLIKSKFSVLDLMQEHYPTVPLRHRGRYVVACCPFHAEKEPSFWIDTERNLFGCHACGKHGDVINFFALAHNLDNSNAIEEMSKRL